MCVFCNGVFDVEFFLIGNLWRYSGGKNIVFFFNVCKCWYESYLKICYC